MFTILESSLKSVPNSKFTSYESPVRAVESTTCARMDAVERPDVWFIDVGFIFACVSMNLILFEAIS
jgi:hypothetical protein